MHRDLTEPSVNEVVCDDSSDAQHVCGVCVGAVGATGCCKGRACHEYRCELRIVVKVVQSVAIMLCSSWGEVPLCGAFWLGRVDAGG